MSVTHGNYGEHTALKVPFLFYYSALYAWEATGYSTVCAVALFGWIHIRWYEQLYLVIAGLTSFMVPFIGALVKDWPLDRVRSSIVIFGAVRPPPGI